MSTIKKIFPLLLFLLGFAIFSYPIFTRWYYHLEQAQVVADFEAGKKALDAEEIEKRMALARAFNAALAGREQEFHDPYVDNVKEGIENYAHMLQVREKIGVVRIPSINVEEPIFAGTSEEVLQIGTGHLEFTSLPIGGEGNHSVITGHRGLPEKRLFSPLNKMKEGDHFYIENIKEILAYEVDQIKIIEPSHFDDLRLFPKKDYVTLLTCTPYMINSHRLLVRGHRISYIPEVAEAEIQAASSRLWLVALGLGIGLFLILFLVIFWRRRRRKKEATQ